MANDVFENFRFSLMQDALPVGIGLSQRLREKGLVSVLESFKSSRNLFNDLRNEGEPLAQSFRDQLDEFSPGLGNPVMSVKVDVDPDIVSDSDSEDEETDSLIKVLNQIDDNLELLDRHFNFAIN